MQGEESREVQWFPGLISRPLPGSCKPPKTIAPPSLRGRGGAAISLATGRGAVRAISPPVPIVLRAELLVLARGSPLWRTTPRILASYEMAAREEGTVLRLNPSEQEDEEDEEAAAARRAQRFAQDPRVRFLGGRLRHALGFPEETWGQYLESEDHRQAIGDFLESTGPASLVFGVAAAGRLSASPEVRRDLRCPLPDLNLKSVSWTQQKSVTPYVPALQKTLYGMPAGKDGCIK